MDVLRNRVVSPSEADPEKVALNAHQEKTA